jgi:hypothetical protein
MTAGQAECGVSFQDALTFAAAAGAPVVEVAAIHQRTASALGVLADSSIQRPRDLDDKVYAGFGYPNEEPTVRAVIEADGGRGEFTTVTLDSAAYEALYAKRADTTIVFTAWEGVEAELRGHRAALLRVQRLRLPAVLPGRARLRFSMAGSRARPRPAVRGGDRPWLRARGADPRRLSRRSSPRTPSLRCEPDLPLASQTYSTRAVTRDADGRSAQTLERWTGYSRFLYEQGLLTGPMASRSPHRLTTPRCSRTTSCRRRDRTVSEPPAP